MKKTVWIFSVIIMMTIVNQSDAAQTVAVEVLRTPFVGTDSAVVYVTALGDTDMRMALFVWREIDSTRVFLYDTLIGWGYYSKNIPVPNLDPGLVYTVWANVYNPGVMSSDSLRCSFTTKTAGPTDVDDISIVPPYDPNELVDVWSFDGRMIASLVRRMDVLDVLRWWPGMYIVRSQKNPEKVQKITMH